MKLLFFYLSVILFNFFEIFADLPFKKYLVPIEIEYQESGLDGVDAIYIINLERRPEKKEKKYELFLSNKLYPNFVKAVDGKDLTKKDWLEITYPYVKSNFIYPGQLGCILSHLSVLKDANNRDFDVIWICEDDVIFLKDVHLISSYLKELDSLDPDWDILYTDLAHHTYDDKLLLNKLLRPNQLVDLDIYSKRCEFGQKFFKEMYRYGTYSYLFSKNGIKKVLDYFDSNSLYSPIDIELNFIPGIKAYSIKEEIVKFDQFEKSDTKKINEKVKE